MTDAPLAILIAEDEPLASMALRAQVEALGHNVLAVARDGADAAALVRCLPADLAIFDMKMPAMSGLDAALDAFPDAPTPVLLLTGFGSADLPDPMPEPPIFALVTKPVGTFLPGDQGALEREWKRQMERLHGIRFDNLYAITNMPISRFLEFLEDNGRTEEYLEQLAAAFNPTAVSTKGAMGLMQVVPGTGRRYGVDDLLNPRANLRAGTQYLSYLMRVFEDDLRLVLAAYNAGEYAVFRHGHAIPPYRETRNYVPRVMSIYEALAAQGRNEAARAAPVAAAAAE